MILRSQKERKVALQMECEFERKVRCRLALEDWDDRRRKVRAKFAAALRKRLQLEESMRRSMVASAMASQQTPAQKAASAAKEAAAAALKPAPAGWAFFQPRKRKRAASNFEDAEDAGAGGEGSATDKFAVVDNTAQIKASLQRAEFYFAFNDGHTKAVYRPVKIDRFLV